MREVIAEVSVVPIGTGGASLSRYVAACLDVLEKHENVRYQVTPMGTIIQGGLKQVLEAVQRMHEAPFAMGAPRVVTTVKIDDRTDKAATMEGKVASVAKARSKGDASRLRGRSESLEEMEGLPERPHPSF